MRSLTSSPASAASPASGSSLLPSRADAYAVEISCTHRNASSASRPTNSPRSIAPLKSSNSELNQVTWLESIQSDDIASRSKRQEVAPASAGPAHLPAGLRSRTATSMSSSSTRIAPRSPWTVYITLRTPAFHDRWADATPVGKRRLHEKSSSVSNGPIVTARALIAVG